MHATEANRGSSMRRRAWTIEAILAIGVTTDVETAGLPVGAVLPRCHQNQSTSDRANGLTMLSLPRLADMTNDTSDNTSEPRTRAA